MLRLVFGRRAGPHRTSDETHRCDRVLVQTSASSDSHGAHPTRMRERSSTCPPITHTEAGGRFGSGARRLLTRSTPSTAWRPAPRGPSTYQWIPRTINARGFDGFLSGETFVREGRNDGMAFRVSEVLGFRGFSYEGEREIAPSAYPTRRVAMPSRRSRRRASEARSAGSPQPPPPPECTSNTDPGATGIPSCLLPSIRGRAPGWRRR